MKLTKKINIETIEVIAEYKVNVHNSPFLAIIEYAKELDEKEYFTDPQSLQEDLLSPLSYQACQNLLDRMVTMSYFTTDDKENYELTDFGMIAASNNSFFDLRNGALKIYKSKENPLLNTTLRIEEIDKTQLNENSNIKKNYPRHLINTYSKLKNKEYIFDKFEPNYELLPSTVETLTLDIQKDHSKYSLLDFEENVELDEDECKKQILNNAFNNTYEDDLLPIDFNPNNLSLIQDIFIKEPYVLENTFQSVTIKNVNVGPKANEALIWYRATLESEVKDYFLSDKQFQTFANTIADRFGKYSTELKNSITREKLASITDNFYTKSKLEAIDYLNY